MGGTIIFIALVHENILCTKACVSDENTVCQSNMKVFGKMKMGVVGKGEASVRPQEYTLQYEQETKRIENNIVETTTDNLTQWGYYFQMAHYLDPTHVLPEGRPTRNH